MACLQLPTARADFCDTEVLTMLRRSIASSLFATAAVVGLLVAGCGQSAAPLASPETEVAAATVQPATLVTDSTPAASATAESREPSPTPSGAGTPMARAQSTPDPEPDHTSNANEAHTNRDC